MQCTQRKLLQREQWKRIYEGGWIEQGGFVGEGDAIVDYQYFKYYFNLSVLIYCLGKLIRKKFL